MARFQAIEDNAGGLHLFVFDEDGNVIYGAAGYEFCGSDLKEAVGMLQGGANPDDEGWEDNIESTCGVTNQEAYDSFTEDDHANGGWEIVADQDGIYPENMGYNAKQAFGIEDDE